MAHEISTTTVRLTLHRDHTWTAFIVTAPQTLANKLELEAGRPRSSGLTEAALRAELDGFLAALARHIDVRFDGVKSPAAVSISDIQVVFDAVRPDFIELKAAGSIPPEARTVSWQYDLSVLDICALSGRRRRCRAADALAARRHCQPAVPDRRQRQATLSVAVTANRITDDIYGSFFRPRNRPTKKS